MPDFAFNIYQQRTKTAFYEHQTRSRRRSLHHLIPVGGRRFLVMTGADKLMAASRTASNPNPWLRMDLRHNQAQVNRLKITLMPTDTYKVEFYHQKLVDWEPVITNQQTFEMVYGEDLPALLPRSRATIPTCSPYMMRASEAPTIIHPGWNQYRRQLSPPLPTWKC